jgi:hypothetical protein
VWQKEAARSGNSGSCWCRWQTVGNAPDENRFTMLRAGEMPYNGAVFEVEKEIPAYT